MSLGTKACMVFCGLNGVCAFFIAYCFKVEIASMAITVSSRDWSNSQKVHALRNAGILYFSLAFILFVRSVLLDRRAAKADALSRGARLREYELTVNDSHEVEPLLGPQRGARLSHSNSYGSESPRE